jgi:hypothetical protein
LCDDENLWEISNRKPCEVYKIVDEAERRVSLFDICKIQNDENRFSNALSYFILQYPEIWQKLLQDLIESEDLGEIESVTREEDAKVSNNANTGGRIDLLIRTKKYYIIIENKIESGIIKNNELTQLARYYHYVKYLQEEQIAMLNEEKKKVKKLKDEQKQKLENPRNRNSKKRCVWENMFNECKGQLDNIESQKKEVESKLIKGLVLTPNYNKPNEELLKVKDDFSFKAITYKFIYGWLQENAQNELKNDVNFKDFYNAMKPHTYDYKSDALYEDMLEKFVRRIRRN